jgi:glycosyltransferase involved in cell wall biosynthesis
MRTSVVITCYNYARYLEGCVASVLNQSLPASEVIIIDDGSTDETPQLLERLSSIPRVRCERQDNLGQAKAKNAGARLCTGEAIAFLDADDLWERDKLALQGRCFDDPRVGVVYSTYSAIDEGGRAMDTPTPRGYLAPRRGNVTKWLVFDNFVPFSSAIVRRNVFAQAGGFDESLDMGIDWDLWLRLSCQVEFDFVPQPLLRYRVGHSGQMSRNWERRLEMADRIFARFRQANPNIVVRSLLRAVDAYNLATRGIAYRGVDLHRSTEFLLRAVVRRPWALRPYVGLAGNVLRACVPGWQGFGRR